MRLPFAIPAALIGLVWPAPASAQSPVPPPAGTKDASKEAAGLSSTMETTLRKAGFTDLQILPNSVFVRGKDKAGNPVAMVLDPKSMTELVTLDPHAGSAAGGSKGGLLTGSSAFATVLPNETLTSALVGTAIANRKGDALGTIRDIAIDHGGVHAYVVRVGGLLGIAEHYIAVTPTALTLVFDKPAGRYKATMDATPEQMKAAPEFRYADVDAAGGK